MPVAVNTGIGGQTGFVAADKLVHNLFGKIFLEIEGVEGNSQIPGHTSGILHIVQGAAFAFGQVLFLGRIEPHGGSDAVKTGFFGQKCGYGAVHAAAHSDQGFLLFQKGTLLCFFLEYISAGRDCQCQFQDAVLVTISFEASAESEDFMRNRLPFRGPAENPKDF